VEGWGKLTGVVFPSGVFFFAVVVLCVQYDFVLRIQHCHSR
jgi:hypothetical protein